MNLCQDIFFMELHIYFGQTAIVLKHSFYLKSHTITHEMVQLLICIPFFRIHCSLVMENTTFYLINSEMLKERLRWTCQRSTILKKKRKLNLIHCGIQFSLIPSTKMPLRQNYQSSQWEICKGFQGSIEARLCSALNFQTNVVSVSILLFIGC